MLAHQGGWDEMLMVLVPIAIFAALLVVANRRANRIEGQRDREHGGGGRSATPDRHRDGPAAR
jgi:hypothetical protein